MKANVILANGQPLDPDNMPKCVKIADCIGKVIVFRTANSGYTFKPTDARHGTIQGGKRWPEPTPVSISGCTWGGSMMRVGVISVEMHAEIFDSGKTRLTSEIQSIVVKDAA